MFFGFTVQRDPNRKVPPKAERPPRGGIRAWLRPRPEDEYFQARFDIPYDGRKEANHQMFGKYG